MEKVAFAMQLRPGNADVYRARHDAIWPDLIIALKSAGISDYSIHLDAASGTLLATLWRCDNHAMDTLPDLPVMRRWWAHMADLMDTEPDGGPRASPLLPMFHLD